MRATTTRCGWLAAAALVLPLAAAGQAPEGAKPLAEVEITEKALRFQPLGRFARLDLAVSGPRGDWRRSFEGGETPVFEVGDSKWGEAADGGYDWELRGVPVVSREIRRKQAELREAEARGEEIDPRKLPTVEVPPALSGSFTVRDGRIVVQDAREPEPKPRQEVTEIQGDLEVAGSLRVRGSKEFVAAGSSEGSRFIHFAALEGPEVGTYLRGTARTVGGEAVIELPGYFAEVTEPEGLTVQLTPLDGWTRLYVAEKGTARLVVRSAEGADAAFDYLIQGVRRGYADFDVERPAGPPR